METVAFLLSDGITNGALYGLVALSLILVCTVTRVVNIAQGEYVVLGAFSFASSLNGEFCSLSYLVAGAILVLTVRDVSGGARSSGEKTRLIILRAAWGISLLAVDAIAVFIPGTYALAAIAAVFTTASIGPIVYRLTVEPNPEASPVFLLIVSLGVYLVLHSVAVLLWGSEAQFVPAIIDGGVTLGSIFVTYQSLAICVTSLLIMSALYGFSQWTLVGQALQAVAVNRVGAQLCGIPVRTAGQMSFAIGAAFSALSGLLLAPLITANTDMGFAVGLKGFVGATLGGIVEYPTAILGVVLVGTVESLSTYVASAFKDSVVFLFVIPILLWRNAIAPLSE